ncbi:ABC transporter substrate-binding protein [Roseivirga sp.]|uniref:ABC transporter substrate-binding protein n=1 Tax=Roseivirga sp. TaxID=1964215 RepID=UPI003B517388
MKRLTKKITRSGAQCLLLCFLLAALVGSCSSGSSTDKAGTLDLQQDHFPHKVAIQHAIGFDIEYHNYWKELRLFRHYNDLVDTVRFALVLKGAPQPDGYSAIRTIEIPSTSLATTSTTHLGMFEMLQALPQLKAVQSKSYVSSDTIRQLIDQGKISEMAKAGMMNVEEVIASGINVLLGVGYPNSQNDNYQMLENAGIPVLLNADWQERSLLGRAEWVKMLAALLNKEQLVNEEFARIESSYNEVLGKLEEVEEAPLTITGLAEGDAWYVAGGKSFAHQLLKLANVDYPWSDNESTGSLRLDFETVYEYGLEAEYWMVPSTATTMDEILAADSRYADFKSYKNQHIYNIYGRYTPGGGNDFYESAVVNPDVVLKDIIKIFHPDLFPEHELVYYNRLR